MKEIILNEQQKEWLIEHLQNESGEKEYSGTSEAIITQLLAKLTE